MRLAFAIPESMQRGRRGVGMVFEPRSNEIPWPRDTVHTGKHNDR